MHMSTILGKAIGIWFVLVVAAVVNGVFREEVLGTVLDGSILLLASCLLLAVLIFLVTFILIPFIGASKSIIYIGIGLLWVVLTVSFEFLFGSFVAGHSWQEIMQVFNITKGNLFMLDLITTAVSPWTAARLRGMLCA
jgi:hypothetical protein